MMLNNLKIIVFFLGIFGVNSSIVYGQLTSTPPFKPATHITCSDFKEIAPNPVSTIKQESADIKDQWVVWGEKNEGTGASLQSYRVMAYDLGADKKLNSADDRGLIDLTWVSTSTAYVGLPYNLSPRLNENGILTFARAVDSFYSSKIQIVTCPIDNCTSNTIKIIEDLNYTQVLFTPNVHIISLDINKDALVYTISDSSTLKTEIIRYDLNTQQKTTLMTKIIPYFPNFGHLFDASINSEGIISWTWYHGTIPQTSIIDFYVSSPGTSSPVLISSNPTNLVVDSHITYQLNNKIMVFYSTNENNLNFKDINYQFLSADPLSEKTIIQNDSNDQTMPRLTYNRKLKETILGVSTGQLSGSHISLYRWDVQKSSFKHLADIQPPVGYKNTKLEAMDNTNVLSALVSTDSQYLRIGVAQCE